MLAVYSEEIVSSPPNHDAGGLSLVGCQQLLIRCIHSCPPYLEAVSSIHNLRAHHTVVMNPLNTEHTFTVYMQRQALEKTAAQEHFTGNRNNLIIQPHMPTKFEREAHNTIQCNTIQYNTIQYSTVQYSTVQYNTIHDPMN
jgi:hypothetical protein